MSMDVSRPPAPQADGLHLLVVDTDAGVRWSLDKGLSNSGYRVRSVGSMAEAIELIRGHAFSLVLVELLPEAGLGLDVVSTFAQAPGNPCIVCTSIEGAPQTIIDCMRRGASGFLVKPFSLAAVRAEIATALSARKDARQKTTGQPGAPVAETVAQPSRDISYIVGASPAIQELRTIIQQVARTDLNCLVRGESGTGKDLVAREIHRLSQRREQAFIKVNCSALPEQLLESELFGYEKGAFTGALAPKPGRFSLANKGIIFLDEIGEMHMSVQAKLLQVIEHKEFTTLGGRKPTRVDVQIVAATNADIEGLAKQGQFRHDLIFRLNEVCIWVPPLSERKEDIPLLVRHFVQKHARFTCGTPIDITGQDIAMLCERDWPGNVRELESTIKRWMVLRKHDMPPAVKRFAVPDATQEYAASAAPAPAVPLEAADGDSDGPSPELILKTLEECQWNRRKATEVLGISYQALRRRISKYNLDHRS